MNPNDIAHLWQRLKPHAVRDLAVSATTGSGTSGSLTSHSLSGPYHSGTLAESQAPWAVTDSEFAAHTSNPNAHHFRAHEMLSISDHTYTGGAALDVFGLSAASTLAKLTPSAAPGTTDSLLKSVSGLLTLPQFTATTQIITPMIDAPAGLLIEATGDITLSPDGFDVILDTSVNLWTSNYVSGTAGWRLPANGAADILSVTTNEMTSRQSIYGAGTAFRVLHHTHDYDHAHVVVNPGGSWNLDEQFGVDIDDNLLVRGYIVGKHAIQLPGAMMICHYDGAEPYENNYTGNAMGHMGQVGVEGGGVVYRPGKFGKAVQIAESTTNLISNPSFETGAGGWAAWYGTGSAVVSANNALYGTYSLALSATGANYTWYHDGIALYNNEYLTVSAYFLGAGSATIYLYDIDSSTSRATGTATGDSITWTRITATWLNSSGVAKNIRVGLEVDTAGATLYFDGIQAEKKAYATPYADGSMDISTRPGEHAWTGTAHGSTTVRTTATLAYDASTVLSPLALTIGCWVRRSGVKAGYIVTHPSMAIEFL